MAFAKVELVQVVLTLFTQMLLAKLPLDSGRKQGWQTEAWEYAMSKYPSEQAVGVVTQEVKS